LLAGIVAAVTGMVLFVRAPFPESNLFLRVVAIRSASAFLFFKYSYTLFLYTTPYIAYSIVLSGLYIFALRANRKLRAGKLPFIRAFQQNRTRAGHRRTASSTQANPFGKAAMADNS
jgi:hypothetical protein